MLLDIYLQYQVPNKSKQNDTVRCKINLHNCGRACRWYQYMCEVDVMKIIRSVSVMNERSEKLTADD